MERLEKVLGQVESGLSEPFPGVGGGDVAERNRGTVSNHCGEYLPAGFVLPALCLMQKVSFIWVVKKTIISDLVGGASLDVSKCL